MRARTLSCLIGCLATLAACSPATQQPAMPATSTVTGASHLPTRSDVDRFLKDGPEPTLQALRPLDFWVQYKMMQATGIEQALGGETQTIAAMKAMGDAYERKLRGAEAEAPKMIPAAFTGEGMSSGMAGLGMGAFAGVLTGGMLSGAVSSMSDRDLADLVKAGPIKFDGGGGNAELSLGEDGSLTQSMAFDVNEHGLNGKVKIKIHMDACPDTQGKLTVHLDVDSSMSVSGKPGTGGHVHTQFDYERYLDDDAHLIDNSDGGASNLRIQLGGIENFEQQQVDITTGHERGGKEVFIHHDESGLSIFHPEEVDRMRGMIRGAELLNTVIAEAMLRGLGSASAPWESGRCVKLDVTSDPSKRKGIRPNTAFDLEAKPRAKADGAPAGGNVTAILSGGASLQPASGKVAADAKFQYAGPDKKDQAANVQFEARSKRGVGKATLEFDTKQGGYRIIGGQNDFKANTIVCSIEGPFDIPSSVGIVMHMSPSGDQGGSWTQSGNAAGVRWSGGGTYTLALDAAGNGALRASGTATIKTPMGSYTDSVEPRFRVSSANGEECR